jgi:hypothetical protein
MVYTWIENWLKNRTQRIQFDGDSSNWTSVLSYVRQGSVLEPFFLFILATLMVGQKVKF